MPQPSGAEPLALGAGLGAGWEEVRALQCPMGLPQGQSALQAVFKEQWWVGKGELQRLSWVSPSSSTVPAVASRALSSDLNCRFYFKSWKGSHHCSVGAACSAGGGDGGSTSFLLMVFFHCSMASTH